MTDDVVLGKSSFLGNARKKRLLNSRNYIQSNTTTPSTSRLCFCSFSCVLFLSLFSACVSACVCKVYQVVIMVLVAHKLTEKMRFLARPFRVVGCFFWLVLLLFPSCFFFMGMMPSPKKKTEPKRLKWVVFEHDRRQHQMQISSSGTPNETKAVRAIPVVLCEVTYRKFGMCVPWLWRDSGVGVG